MSCVLDAQRELEFTRGSSRIRKYQHYDEANLRCARLILRERTRYERECRYLITWAEAVIKRLERTVTGERAA